jgi:hypothetical protein
VISGRKSEEQVLLEFLETFETHHSIRNNQAPDHIVTKEEFEEYYSNISASIDNDQYFELMMNNSWKINDGDRTYAKGWTNKQQQKQQDTVSNAGSTASRPQSAFGQAKPAAGQRPATSQQQQPAYSKNQSQTGYNLGFGAQPQ